LFADLLALNFFRPASEFAPILKPLAPPPNVASTPPTPPNVFSTPLEKPLKAGAGAIVWGAKVEAPENAKFGVFELGAANCVLPKGALFPNEVTGAGAFPPNIKSLLEGAGAL